VSLTQKKEKTLKFNIGACFWFILISTIFFWVIVNFDETIEPDLPWEAADSKSIRIPDLSAKLRNNGDKNISLPVKGELWLWPPGDQSWDLEGAYEFKHPDNKKIHTDVISIPAMDEKEFRIQLIKAAPIHQDVAALKRIFRAGGWDIQLIFTTDQKGRSILYSHRIPFTEKGMSTFYTFDVFR